MVDQLFVALSKAYSLIGMDVFFVCFLFYTINEKILDSLWYILRLYQIII